MGNQILNKVWETSNKVRGKIDGWDFRRYVFSILFVIYVTKLSNDFGLKGTDLSESKDIIKDLKNIFIKIESFDKKLEGIFSCSDFENKKLGNTYQARCDTVKALFLGLNEIDFEGSDGDVFGNIYEFLMSLYSQNAGKSGGEFFTASEVSKLISLIATNGKKTIKNAYDPSCGSGSLLLKVAKQIGNENISDGIYGQDINLESSNLCKMNMIISGIDTKKFHIACDDTLIKPKHLFKNYFDVITSNPPYSVKWVGDDDVTLINDPRFAPAGVLAPKSKADFAFIMHCLYVLSDCGVAAIVCFPGIFYRAGAEQKIRQYLVDNNFVDSVILLPENIFFGTSISTCILVLKKNRTRKSIFFVDASKQFIKDSKKNKLSDENINNILLIYNDMKDIKNVARNVDAKEIKNNNYSLAVSNYVKNESTKPKINIFELNQKIKNIVHKENSLRENIDSIVQDLSTIFGDDGSVKD